MQNNQSLQPTCYAYDCSTVNEVGGLHDTSSRHSEARTRLNSALFAIGGCVDLIGPSGNKDAEAAQLLTLIPDLLREGKLLLVLGAGVSIGAGLPSWHQLVRDLFTAIGEKVPDTFDTRTLFDVFRRHHCRDDEEYLDLIARGLYRDVPSAFQLSESPIMRAVGTLAVANFQFGSRGIFSFSFDDLLETYLAAYGVPVTSLWDINSWSNNSGITVYHPHGFLPSHEGADRSSQIVLDTGSYHRFVDSVVGNSWRSFMLSQFRTHFCVFVGLSFSDMYLSTILAQAGEEHASRADDLPSWGVTFSISADDPSQLMLRDRGIETLTVDGWDEIPRILYSLTKPPRQQESSDNNKSGKSMNTDHHSVFISYGGPDESFASQLNATLAHEGVRTFLFAEHAIPGQKLHALMRDGVNAHDRVVLICSQASLERAGVLNEIEETLQREAREGGTALLIPITLDDYVFGDWAPKHPGIAQAIRDRVVADFRGADSDVSKYNKSIRLLIAALNKTLNVETSE